MVSWPKKIVPQSCCHLCHILPVLPSLSPGKAIALHRDGNGWDTPLSLPTRGASWAKLNSQGRISDSNHRHHDHGKSGPRCGGKWDFEMISFTPAGSFFYSCSCWAISAFYKSPFGRNPHVVSPGLTYKASKSMPCRMGTCLSLPWLLTVRGNKTREFPFSSPDQWCLSSSPHHVPSLWCWTIGGPTSDLGLSPCASLPPAAIFANGASIPPAAAGSHLQ